MDKKGPNFTSAETHALLQSVRNNYDSIVGSFNREGGATKVKSGIWMEVTDNVNATGSGHKRTVDQVRLRWKNLKQQATKDNSQAKNPQTGNKAYKRGQYTDVVLDIIGGQQSQSLHGIPNVVLDGESQVCVIVLQWLYVLYSILVLIVLPFSRLHACDHLIKGYKVY